MIAVNIFEGMERNVLLFTGMMSTVPQVGWKIRLKHPVDRTFHKPTVREVVYDLSSQVVEVYVR